jgi:hypothetical protein
MNDSVSRPLVSEEITRFDDTLYRALFWSYWMITDKVKNFEGSSNELEYKKGKKE